jgi:spermidine synthase
VKSTPHVAEGASAASAAAVGISPRLARYLYLTSALTGAAILVVEILGAKMLAPYFGTSHFVWTAQITVTLISLAGGYYLGGRMADRSPQLGRMYGCILAASIYLCVSVPLCSPVSFACLKVMNLAMGSLLAAVFLFLPPLTLLAVVGPFLVRNFTQTVNSVGRQVGRLSALSTLGSVAGTILIGYVMIPFLPNSVTMYLTAVVLMAIAVGFFALVGRKPSGAATVVMLAGLVFGLSTGYLGVRRDGLPLIPGFAELERCNSNFGQMVVAENTNWQQRLYFNDLLTQNTYDPETKKSTSMFTYMLHGLAQVYTPKIERALCIGLGVGIVPMSLAADGARVDVVEINPQVAGLAQRHFGFDPAKVNLVIDDGRHFLNECPPSYDTIILDAFLGDSSPSHLMTREAFAAMRHALKPGGTLVINSFGDLDPGKNFFTASLERTLQATFKSVHIHTAFGGNILFVASDQPDLKFLREPDYADVHPRALRQTKEAFENQVSTPPHDGRVLTDNYNPVDYYDARNRESVRRNLTAYLRTSPAS